MLLHGFNKGLYWGGGGGKNYFALLDVLIYTCQYATMNKAIKNVP